MQLLTALSSTTSPLAMQAMPTLADPAGFASLLAGLDVVDGGIDAAANPRQMVALPGKGLPVDPAGLPVPVATADATPLPGSATEAVLMLPPEADPAAGVPVPPPVVAEPAAPAIIAAAVAIGAVAGVLPDAAPPEADATPREVPARPLSTPVPPRFAVAAPRQRRATESSEPREPGDTAAAKTEPVVNAVASTVPSTVAVGETPAGAPIDIVAAAPAENVPMPVKPMATPSRFAAPLRPRQMAEAPVLPAADAASVPSDAPTEPAVPVQPVVDQPQATIIPDRVAAAVPDAVRPDVPAQVLHDMAGGGRIGSPAPARNTMVRPDAPVRSVAAPIRQVAGPIADPGIIPPPPASVAPAGRQAVPVVNRAVVAPPVGSVADDATQTLVSQQPAVMSVPDRPVVASPVPAGAVDAARPPVAPVAAPVIDADLIEIADRVVAALPPAVVMPRAVSSGGSRGGPRLATSDGIARPAPVLADPRQAVTAPSATDGAAIIDATVPGTAVPLPLTNAEAPVPTDADVVVTAPVVTAPIVTAARGEPAAPPVDTLAAPIPANAPREPAPQVVAAAPVPLAPAARDEPVTRADGTPTPRMAGETVVPVAATIRPASAAEPVVTTPVTGEAPRQVVSAVVAGSAATPTEPVTAKAPPITRIAPAIIAARPEAIVADGIVDEAAPLSRKRRDDDVAPLPTAAPAPDAVIARPVTAPVAAGPATLDTRSAAWMEGMIDHIETLQGAGGSHGETRIRLSPDALGDVEISIRTARDGSVEVRFNSENADAGRLLADAQPRLAQMAEARGLKLGGMQVDVGTQQQQQRQGQDQPATPARAPRSAASAATPDTNRSDDRIA